jgi:hypothetical protein
VENDKGHYCFMDLGVVCGIGTVLVMTRVKHLPLRFECEYSLRGGSPDNRHHTPLAAESLRAPDAHCVFRLGRVDCDVDEPNH